MKLNLEQSEALAKEYVANKLYELDQNSQIIIAAEFIALEEVVEAVEKTGILVAAQNCGILNGSQALTGEVSTDHLADLGVSCVVLGHSERRTILGETDEMVNQKVKNALSSNVRPIICIGETESERLAKRTTEVVTFQIERALANVDVMANVSNIIIAYEPVWAISSTANAREAKPEEISEVLASIREFLTKNYGAAAQKITLLYGGSVTPDNAKAFKSLADIQGFLIGGSSLDVARFKAVIEA